MEQSTHVSFARFIVISFLVSLLLNISGQGCVWTDQTYSRPTISTTRDWSMTQKCGYESCASKVDFLVGKDVTIRIEAHNDIPHAIKARVPSVVEKGKGVFSRYPKNNWLMG